MANHKSAAKRARQTITKRARNHGTKKAIRTVEKTLLTAIDKKDKKNAATTFVTYTSKIDKAAQKGIIHQKNAARKKSRLAARISSI